MKKIFIDTNVFLDSFDSSREYFNSAVSAFEKLIIEDYVIYTSCDIVTTIYYFLTKSDKAKALIQVNEINQLCKIIEFSNKEVVDTIELIQTDKDYADLEDTMQYILAKKENCDLIISNDKKFVAKEVKLLSSIEFLEY